MTTPTHGSFCDIASTAHVRWGFLPDNLCGLSVSGGIEYVEWLLHHLMLFAFQSYIESIACGTSVAVVMAHSWVHGVT